MGIYLIDYENTKKTGLTGLELLQPEDTVILFYSEHADTMTFDMHRRINETKADFQLQKANVGTKNALDFELVTYLGYLIGTEAGRHYYIVSGDKGFQSVCKYWSSRNVRVSLVPNLTARDAEPKGKKAAKAAKKQAKAETPAEPKATTPEKTAKTAKSAKKQTKSEAAKKHPEVEMAPEAAMTPEAPKTRKGRKAKKAKSEDAGLVAIRNEVVAVIEKKDVADKVAKIIFNYKTKQGINNALMREFPSQDNKQASIYYKAIKPLIKNKKGRESM